LLDVCSYYFWQSLSEKVGDGCGRKQSGEMSWWLYALAAEILLACCVPIKERNVYSRT
jgi:hypothetical protein